MIRLAPFTVAAAALLTAATASTPSTAAPTTAKAKPNSSVSIGSAARTFARRDLNSRVLSFARGKVGQRLGDGECTRLVEQALSAVSARRGTFPADGRYVWGTRVSLAQARPGDIIQIVKASFQWKEGNGTRSWMTGSQHSAIIERVSGTRLTLLDQNAPQGSPVGRHMLDVGGKISGEYAIYRPIR